MPPDYRHALVCLDLSPDSGEILQRARSLIRPPEGRITLVHVVESGSTPAIAYGLGPPTGAGLDPEAAGRHAESRLRALITAQDSLRMACRVVTGIAHQEITRLAGELKADLIVLGSAQRAGLGRLLGSSARSVMNHAPCDVLAVRIPATGESDAR